MKKFNISYMFMALLALAMTACEDSNFVTMNPNAALTPTASATEVVLTKDKIGTDVLTISWPEPDYGFKAGVKYIISLDVADGDFSSPQTIDNGSALSKTFKDEELNKYLINLGFEPNNAASLKWKVDAVLTTDERLESEPQTITATAYMATLDLSTNWGVVGSGYNNWGDFPDAPFFQTKTTNELVAYVKLLTGEIKFRQNNVWDLNYGDDGADGTLEANGANIAVTAGYYKIVFNPVAKTYSITPFEWGIVGSAYNNWGSDGPDAPFYYDDATDQWRAIVKLKDGEFKIRKNNDWGLNYGDTGGDGILDNGGDNIAVTAGKYLITMTFANDEDTHPTYTIEALPAIWGLVGSAYNNWGSDGPDAQFVRDFHNDGIWVLRNVTLLDGEFKIRDDNSWGTNYGDDGANGTLDLNGANIASAAGIYTVTLDFSNPNAPTWSWVKHK